MASITNSNTAVSKANIIAAITATDSNAAVFTSDSGATDSTTNNGAAISTTDSGAVFTTTTDSGEIAGMSREAAIYVEVALKIPPDTELTLAGKRNRDL